jgi:beta-mannosidase
MLGEWLGAAVEPSEDDAPPAVEEPHRVEVPGRPDALAGADAVAYRTTFPDPREGEETRASVVLEGLYGRARVWHDGELLGEHDTYFRPARFEIEPSAENELVVECRRPTDGFGGVHETDLLPETERVPGIWWDARVETHGPVAFTDLSVQPRLEDDRAVIDAELTVDAADSVDDRVTFSLRPEGFRGGGAMERARLQAAASERTTVRREIEVRDPQFWWPRGLGSQHRYEVRAKRDGEERAATTGFCTVSLDDGLTVNGQAMRARGFNVLPSGEPAADVDAAVEANANLVRAHAHVPSPAFHDACDEAGLLVWQDLPLTGDVEFDPERGEQLADALVGACNAHPSVAAYGVHDDPRAPFETPLGAGRLARSRIRWRAWRTGYDRSADEALAAAYETDRPVVPVAGPPGTDPDAAHIYPGWDYGDADDVEWLLDTYPSLGDVVTEFGAGSRVDIGGDAPDPAGLVARLDAEDAAGSQRRQARTTKRVAETLRRRGADVLAAFALRDVRETGGMGVLDAAGHPKPGYEALADAYRPVQAVLDDTPRPGTAGVSVVNDGHERVEATVEWTAGDRGGSFDASVDPLDSARAGGLKIPDDAEAVRLELVVDGDRTTNTYDL